MTREHKLALIVGFSLLLLVGVLISDHVSSVRRTPINEVVLSEAQVTPGAVPPAVDPMKVLSTPNRPSTAVASAPGTTPAGAPAGAGGPMPVEPAPVSIAQGSMGQGPTGHGPTGHGPMGHAAGGATSPGSAASRAVPTEVAVASGVGSPAAGLKQLGGSLPRDLVEAVGTVGGTIEDQGPDKPAVIRVPGATEVASATPAKPSAASGRPAAGAAGRIETVKYHTVARGDTLIEITRKYYGSDGLWRRLAEFNRVNTGTVRIGQQLRIPPAEVLGGRTVAVAQVDAKPSPAAGGGGSASAPAASKADARTPAKADDKATKGRETKPQAKPAAPATRPRIELATYTVRKGDTLAEIAQRTMGSARRWPELAKFNDLEDADDVPAGTVLRIPSRRL